MSDVLSLSSCLETSLGVATRRRLLVAAAKIPLDAQGLIPRISVRARRGMWPRSDWRKEMEWCTRRRTHPDLDWTDLGQPTGMAPSSLIYTNIRGVGFRFRRGVGFQSFLFREISVFSPDGVKSIALGRQREWFDGSESQSPCLDLSLRL